MKLTLVGWIENHPNELFRVMTLDVIDISDINAWMRVRLLTATQIEKIVVYFVVRACVIVVNPKPCSVV